ncbi:Gfo/Idh/MocA family protein [Microvirga arsenatis]|uniref:Gfo/Idh/MocA family oxidoreductase n=1 Tax=Microvirga arsenatis TaxID=2692265 RepID=A0ABW9YZN2_9HYPH|nr:Gfo/Idh/MocA family oxidoreductase [Microvirga arsenatis]NBJ11422.1 Gfo/Idh/MocA family oxidoreductase [Microvirga arsenatis]NBJ25695.1 Gfo/Idh/MocA family oxidoreductase [Microvirga arsenatis]
MKPVRWGVLSTAKIGRFKVVPGMMKSPLCDVVAVASRDEASARAMAGELGIRKAYGSYEALLADPEIEAVYNPLPNHLHVPMTLAAAAAGKHVLCEKPIAISADEAEQLAQASAQVLIAEAFMVRHHPQWHRAREIVREGRIGEARAIQVIFSYFNVDPANIRNRPDIGGGGLLDIGCYAVVAGRYLFEAEPLRVVSLVDRDPSFGVDRTTSALMDFGGGRQLTFTVSTQLVPFQRVQVLGTKGRIEIEIPFNAPPDRPTRIFLDDGSQHGGLSAQAVDFPVLDQYQFQGEAFSRAVRGAEPLAHGLGDALMNMRILDALRRSEATGGWEAV